MLPADKTKPTCPAVTPPAPGILCVALSGVFPINRPAASIPSAAPSVIVPETEFIVLKTGHPLGPDEMLLDGGCHGPLGADMVGGEGLLIVAL